MHIAKLFDAEAAAECLLRWMLPQVFWWGLLRFFDIKRVQQCQNRVEVQLLRRKSRSIMYQHLKMVSKRWRPVLTPGMMKYIVAGPKNIVRSDIRAQWKRRTSNDTSPRLSCPRGSKEFRTEKSPRKTSNWHRRDMSFFVENETPDRIATSLLKTMKNLNAAAVKTLQKSALSSTASAKRWTTGHTYPRISILIMRKMFFEALRRRPSPYQYRWYCKDSIRSTLFRSSVLLPELKLACESTGYMKETLFGCYMF